MEKFYRIFCGSDRLVDWKIFLISGIFIFFILKQLEFDLIKSGFLLFRSETIIIAFGVYLFSYILRAVRWWFLIDDLPLISSIHIVTLHTVSNNLFPFRSGEITFPYFCGRFHNIPLSSSLPALLGARIADLCTLGPLFILALLNLKADFLKFKSFVITAVVFLILAFIFPQILHLLSFLLKKSGLVSSFADKVEELRVNYEELWKGKNLFILFFLSLFIWLVKFGAFYLIASHFNVANFPLNYWKVVLGSTASEMMAAMPIQTFAEFGMFEAGWAGAFMFMGMGRREAVTLGFSLHLTILIFSIIIGMPAYILAFFRRKR